ncbi:MAG: hypothetical protein LC637_01930 [Xanthomonadaceae bacterium]|nr:hypothetical protein [Xanthomonadaceae bacterium]
MKLDTRLNGLFQVPNAPNADRKPQQPFVDYERFARLGASLVHRLCAVAKYPDYAT